MVGDLSSDTARLAARITAKVLPSGELDDRASPELARTRADINRLRSTITRSLEVLMRRQTDAVQDEIVTVRNDRFVIPVRADHRGRVGGVAHGSSSSGMTVFVEPLETIEQNNELQMLREREEREVAQILHTLTEELRASIETIERAVFIVTELDFIAAKTALAIRLDCIEPQINDANISGRLELTDARHPVLDDQLRSAGKAAVPCSFTLDAETPVMVISGANAGGKTVVLKTAGLLALAAASGLHVPARRAEFPLYRAVLADIGDRQSLAANLSTFTAHIANMRRMIELCQSPALVLLDEVGTGTDPEEGSALGVAVVDHFRRQCGAHVVATTHYSGLKMYATTSAGVLNASVEFDEKTLQPTYRLLLGLAGSSSGLEIARRFGFPDAVVDDAVARVDVSAREASRYLQRIQRDSEEATALRLALEEERAAVAEKFAALEIEAGKRERERQTEFARELQRSVADFDRQARELVSKIEDRAARVRVERETERRSAELRTAARQQTEQQASKTAKARAASGTDAATQGGVRVVRHNEELRPAAAPREIKTGDTVRLRTLGTTGTVERINPDSAELLIGSIRFRAKLSDLELLDAATSQQPPEERGSRLKRQAAKSGTQVNLRTISGEANAELKLIGRTTDEAADAVDKFLDEAYVQGLNPLRIVHGIGTGALRRVITELLRSHPHVARFNSAPREQGGEGATIVELKQ
jgi:DNA mismatch repair protein MutS2